MKPKIAVVEDNPDNRMLVEAILEDDSEITEYETGAEGGSGRSWGGRGVPLDVERAT